ncbi:MAG: hypothetical protein AAGF73_14985 [Actinomycetota bacterium]
MKTRLDVDFADGSTLSWRVVNEGASTGDTLERHLPSCRFADELR